MRGRSSAAIGNAVVSAVIELCALYRIPCYRMNSRTLMVPDGRKQGGTRPLSFGVWVDRHGEEHTGGMPDLLLTPTIKERCFHVQEEEVRSGLNCSGAYHLTPTPLWVECKAGSGKLSKEQIAFRDDALACNVQWLLAQDSAAAVEVWLRSYGLLTRKGGR